jgi:hypothetical protein
LGPEGMGLLSLLSLSPLMYRHLELEKLTNSNVIFIEEIEYKHEQHYYEEKRMYIFTM